MVADDLHRFPTLDLKPARDVLDAITVKRPALVARLAAAEPRTKPAIVRRKPRHRPVMKLPRLTRPGEQGGNADAIAWPAAPSLWPLAVVVLSVLVIVAWLALR